MAQTIATQRGTGTATQNTNVTLFTQSGGLSTRVILNQLTLYATSSDWQYPQLQIVHLSSNGASSVIGYMRLGGTGAYSMSMMAANNALGPVQVGGNSGSTFMGGVYYGNVANTWSGNTSPGNQYQGGNGSYYSYMPSNYWIGPGDSIQIKWWDNASVSAVYGFSFTTITES